MNGPELHGWRSRLPEWAEGTLTTEERAELEAAMADDAELREEAELVQAIRRTRVDPPAGLAADISTRLATERAAGAPRLRIAPGWRLSTAAVLILAMGTAVVWQNRFGPMPTLPTVAAEAPLSDAWLLDDGVVAGGAVLDDLTDEELTLLLEELEA